MSGTNIRIKRMSEKSQNLKILSVKPLNLMNWKNYLNCKNVKKKQLNLRKYEKKVDITVKMSRETVKIQKSAKKNLESKKCC